LPIQTDWGCSRRLFCFLSVLRNWECSTLRLLLPIEVAHETLQIHHYIGGLFNGTQLRKRRALPPSSVLPSSCRSDREGPRTGFATAPPSPRPFLVRGFQADSRKISHTRRPGYNFLAPARPIDSPPEENTPPSRKCRRLGLCSAACIPANGSGGQEQGQSLLKASGAPSFSSVCQRCVLCGREMVQQKAGCISGMTESFTRRGRSSAVRLNM